MYLVSALLCGLVGALAFGTSRVLGIALLVIAVLILAGPILMKLWKDWDHAIHAVPFIMAILLFLEAAFYLRESLTVPGVAGVVMGSAALLVGAHAVWKDFF
ncbi:hypothetical protein [Nocardia thailandica]|uniref:hypothetical protein n=1 Tax=Nocardia thailandica TaxID=257275 RepID=UPI0002EF2A07|nr:hypothetical protein [Nocardia thailandica]